MNISPLNTYNNYNRYSNRSTNNSPAFTSVASESSGFFKGFNKHYDKFTDSVAKNVTSKFVETKPMLWLADKFKNTDNLFQHCMTLGSVITSGLYMQRTYTNDKLDKDRRNTLVVNQGLTWALSTVGAYALDKYIKNWWDNTTARFAGHLLNDDQFYSSFMKDKKAITEENKALKAAAKEKGIKPELNSLPKVDKLIEKHANYLALAKDDATKLMNKIKGMGLLRAMIVFGFVYRFFVPVVVTKPANKLCDIYLANKKEKQNNIEK